MNSVVVTLECKITDCSPKIGIGSRHNDFVMFDLNEGLNVFIGEIQFSQVDQLKILFKDKLHSEKGETFIDIKKIEIDDIDLGHSILKGKQWPNYDEQFYKEFNPPHFYQPGTTMYHNGVYELDLEFPLWKWHLNELEKNA